MKISHVFLALFLGLGSLRAEQLNIGGSKILSTAISEAGQKLRSISELEVTVATEGGSSGGIQMLGNDSAQIAMSTRALTAKDRSDFPNISFTPIYLGEQVIALAVSNDVWQAGVRSLSKTQLQAIYEGKIKNWQEVGGPDQRILFFNREIGKGPWEVFAEWVYGDNRKAPLGRFQSIAEDVDTRDALELSNGAMAPLSPVWIDGKNLHALALIGNDSDAAIAPTAQNVINRKYTMSRPLYFFIDDKPTKQVKTMVDFMLNEQGQAILQKHGFVGRSILERLLGQKLPVEGP